MILYSSLFNCMHTPMHMYMNVACNTHTHTGMKTASVLPVGDGETASFLPVGDGETASVLPVGDGEMTSTMLVDEGPVIDGRTLTTASHHTVRAVFAVTDQCSTVSGTAGRLPLL
jgi:hypothetical protein